VINVCENHLGPSQPFYSSFVGNMRQTDYKIGAAVSRTKRRRETFHRSLLTTASPIMQFHAYQKLKRTRQDVRKINLRSLQVSSATFNLNSYSDHDALSEFRFRTREIGRIAEVMGWHGGLTKRSRYRCDNITACCIVLRKLATPCRWYDLETTFGMRSSKMSEVFWEVVECFVENKGHLLTELRVDLIEERAEQYAVAVKEKGAPLDNCLGFIDCSKIEMSRPGGNGTLQRSCYSGHKRMHCLVYQTITTPDGLILHLYGPEVGRRHDLTLLRNSGIEEIMEQRMVIGGKQYCIYGDAAYMLRVWLQTAFPRLTVTPVQAVYNKRMSAVREAVEWSYKDIKQMWSSQDFKRNLKVRKSPIALLYTSAALLFNFKVCLGHGGQVASYFNCAAPSLERYLSTP